MRSAVDPGAYVDGRLASYKGSGEKKLLDYVLALGFVDAALANEAELAESAASNGAPFPCPGANCWTPLEAGEHFRCRSSVCMHFP